MSEDYCRIFNADIESYKDYLLEREKYIDGIWEKDAIRILHVPFDEGMYREWLKQAMYFKDSPEARTAWTIDTAMDSQKLQELLNKHPLMPRPPFEEETTISVIFIVVPATVESFNDVLAFTDKFSLSETTEIYNTCLAYLNTEPFEQISKLRSRGMKVVLGDRLILPDKALDCAGYYRSIALSAEGVVPAPKSMTPDGANIKRLHLLTKKCCPAPVLGLYPVTLVGSNSDVLYCEGLLVKEGGCSAPAVSLEVILQDRMPDKIAGTQTVPSFMIKDYLDEIAEDLAEKLGPEGEAVIYPNGNLKAYALSTSSRRTTTPAPTS